MKFYIAKEEHRENCTRAISAKSQLNLNGKTAKMDTGRDVSFDSAFKVISCQISLYLMSFN